MAAQLGSLWNNRFVRFTGIGVICMACVHAPILMIAAWLGLGAVFSDAVGFLSSTLVNYFLQRRFNFGGGGNWVNGLIRYLATSFGSLIVNLTIFQIAYSQRTLWFDPPFSSMVAHFAVFQGHNIVSQGVRVLVSPLLISALLGAAVGTVFNFIASRKFVFTPNRETETGNVETNGLSWNAVRMQIRHEGGVAFFIPVWNEVGNLRRVVMEIVGFFEQMDWPFTLTIVNDGSTDGSAELAEELADPRPNVRVVHLPRNLGYGAAVKAGCVNSLMAHNRHPYIAFFDGDGQFDIKDLLGLAHALLERGADFSVGHRVKRADGQGRRLAGGAWQMVCQILLGLTASDTDCGFKMYRREVVCRVAPKLRFSRGAAGNAEFFARAAHFGFKFSERPVRHLPRQTGESTGMKPIVALISGLNAWQLRLELWALSLQGLFVRREGTAFPYVSR